MQLYNLHSKQIHRAAEKGRERGGKRSSRERAVAVTVTIRKVTQSTCKQEMPPTSEAVKLHNKTNNNYQRHCQGKERKGGRIAEKKGDRERERERLGIEGNVERETEL